MTHYYFDIDHGGDFTYDLEGHACESRKSMRDRALLRLLRDLEDGLPDGSRRVVEVKVRDKDGHYVLRATLSLTIEWLDETPEGMNSEVRLAH